MKWSLGFNWSRDLCRHLSLRHAKEASALKRRRGRPSTKDLKTERENTHDSNQVDESSEENESEFGSNESSEHGSAERVPNTIT